MWVLQMLEWFGFCAAGEAGPFVAEGRTRPGGALPVNTSGGQLSESYMWGWLHLCEAVTPTARRVRLASGRRAEVALIASSHDFVKGAGSVLARTIA